MRGGFRIFFRSIRLANHLTSFSQAVVYLPLILEIAGRQAFLSLSLSLAVYYFVAATLNLICRNTRLAPLRWAISASSNFTMPALLLLSLNLFTASSESITTKKLFASSGQPSFWVWILQEAPLYWGMVLRYCSPVFALLEAIATVLVIQAAGQVSRFFVEERSESWQFVFLISAAAVYVICAWNLYFYYFYAAASPLNASLIGVSITTVIFLSAISFASRRANLGGSLVEASLMLGYVVYNIYLLATDGPGLISFLPNFHSTEPSLPPRLVESFSAIFTFISQTFGQGIDFIAAAVSALPLPVLLGLSYRVIVIYLAGNVLVAWKKGKADYDEFTRLSDEDPGLRLFTIILSYSKFLLIAVYTHLLLLDSSGHQTLWRWVSVAAVCIIWAVEIVLGKDEDNEESVLRGLRLKTD